MPLTGADLIAPKGEVERALFPNETDAALAARLDGYLADGQARAAATLTVQADIDRAATVFVYYRAASAAYSRILASPTSVTVANEGGTVFTTEQLRALKGRADDYKQEWLSLIADPTVSPGVTPLPATESTPNYFVW